MRLYVANAGVNTADAKRRRMRSPIFPDPGPAMTRIGPSGAVTASGWRSLSVARSCSWSYPAVDLLGTVVGMSDGMVWEEEVSAGLPVQSVVSPWKKSVR